MLTPFPDPLVDLLLLRAPLTVTKSGAGAGAVTGAGIDCGSDCAHVYNRGYSVVLTAAPAGGSTFSGWSGAGSGTGVERTVPMTQAGSVDAGFAVVGGVVVIPATVSRYDGGSGPYTVTNGVAFRPGDVTTTLLTNRQLRVLVDGVEKAIYTEALDGRHPDGSVKVVLIQFSHSVGATPLSAEIRLGETRSTTDLAKQPINPWPRVLLYPTSPTTLCAAQPFWRPLTPMTNRPTSPSYWNDWELRYSSQAPFTTIGSTPIWNDALAQPTPNRWNELHGTAVYNWGKHHYEFFAMTGNGAYLDRAIGGAYLYISEYLGVAPQNWAAPEHVVCNAIDHLLHYWMTGDNNTRDGIRKTLENSPVIRDAGTGGRLFGHTSVLNHGRIHWSCLAYAVMGYHLNLTPVANVWPEAAATWAAKAKHVMEAALTQQFADGSNSWPDANGGQQNWQVFMRSTGMVMYHEWVGADARIQPHIQAAFDYINNNYWFVDRRAWSLGDADSGLPSTTGAPDLNGFGAEIVSWLYRKIGGAALKTRGDQVIEGIVNFAFWPTATQNAKQFNEEHWGSWPWVAARLV